MEINHLNAGRMEQIATSPDLVHLLGCSACQEKVTRYTEVYANTPLEQYPTED